MKILFVFPFCSPTINSIAYVPMYLGSIGHKVLVITAQHANSLKGNVSSVPFEVIGNVTFYRPYYHSKDLYVNTRKYWKIARDVSKEFGPEVLIVFSESNFKLATALKEYLGIPLLYFLEYIHKVKPFPPIKGRKLMRKYFNYLYHKISDEFLRKIVEYCDALMFSYYGDVHYINKIEDMGTKAYYVPWCNEIMDFNISEHKEKGTGIYIGSLTDFKNAKELISALPLIFEKTSIKRFTVIGPGPYAKDILRLRDIYKDKLIYFESMSRQEALKLLANAEFAYTPVINSGLGFIGDCWAMKTPLIATHDLDGFLKDNVDTLIAQDYKKLPEKINLLNNRYDYYVTLRDNGFKRYKDNYSASAVGEMYLRILADLNICIVDKSE